LVGNFLLWVSLEVKQLEHRATLRAQLLQCVFQYPHLVLAVGNLLCPRAGQTN